MRLPRMGSGDLRSGDLALDILLLSTGEPEHRVGVAVRDALLLRLAERTFAG